MSSGSEVRRVVKKTIAGLPSFWAALDRAARADGLTRSAYIQRAVESYQGDNIRLLTPPNRSVYTYDDFTAQMQNADALPDSVG